MLVKIVIIIFLCVILYSLGSGLYYLTINKGRSEIKVVEALTWRIALSLLLFILLFIAYALGWIHPHGV